MEVTKGSGMTTSQSSARPSVTGWSVRGMICFPRGVTTSREALRGRDTWLLRVLAGCNIVLGLLTGQGRLSTLGPCPIGRVPASFWWSQARSSCWWGGFLPAGGKSGVIGRLPGDFRIQRDGFSFYFPLATSLLLSILLTVLLNL